MNDSTPLNSAVARRSVVGTALGFALTAGQLCPAAAQTASDAVKLPEISVEGQTDSSDYKVDRAQSPKFTAPLLDTPKSVTVIPREVIEERAATSLQDVLRTTPGITLGSGEGGNPIGDRPFIRGFDSMSDTFVDGIRDTSSQTREIFNLEQVEISKGPGSAYTGRGSTGGSINLVTKTPKAENFVAGSLTAGTDKTKRATADINQAVTDNVAVRLNAMAHKADVAGRDAVEVSRWGVAPSVTIGLNGPTKLTLSYYHMQTDDIPDYGIPYDPRTGRPADVDLSNFYGLVSRDFQKIKTDIGTVSLEHELNDHWTIRNATRYSWSENNYIVTNPDDSRGNVANGRVWRSPKTRNSDTDTLLNQTDLFGDFMTGSLKHSVSTGVELSREHVRNRGYTVASGNSNCTVTGLGAPYNCTSLFAPNPYALWTGTITPAATYTDTTTTTASVYAFDTIELTPQWSINGGLRYDRYKTREKASRLENDSGFLNYQVGVVYKPLPNGSIYVSHGTSSNPSGETAGEGSQSLSLTNANLDPERNRSYEIGTKWDVLNRKLSLTGAVFRIEKTNARITNPLGGDQLLVGEQRVDGFELGVTGSITDKWKVFSGYTYLHSEIVDGGPAHTNEGKEFPNTPRHSFSLWSTYKPLEDVTIGGGAFYMSKRYGDAANTKSVPSFWRFDAMAAYQWTEQVGFQLNAQNIFDKRYFDKPYTTHFATVAPGRTVLLSTNFKF